jgi:hypothetical protein
VIAPHRRAFLAAASFTAIVGCRRPNGPSGDVTRIASDKAAREKHLAALADFRVPVEASFLTPPRPVNLLDLFPEVKPLQRITLRLHPGYSDEPPPAATKLGGRILWPADEPWPVCEVFKIPLVPVLQLTADDAPPQVKFKPGTDLMQLLWSPRDHGSGGPKPTVVWRKAADVTGPLAELPDTSQAYLNYVPVPCRVFPERVTEFPDWHTVPRSSLREKIEAWKPDGGRNPVEFYERELSAAPGTKVGGYPRWLGPPNPATCAVCKRGMDYLLTIDIDELYREKSWCPSTDALMGQRWTRHPNPAGLTLPEPGNVHVFVCRRCDDWPAKAAR